jgi:type IV secretory pathway VirB10-like protein
MPSPSARLGMPFKVAGVLALGLVAVSVWWFGAKEGASNPPAMAGVPALSQAGSTEAQPVRVGTAVTLSATAAPPPPGESGVAAQTERNALKKAASEEARINRQAAAKARREQAAGERAAAEEQARAAKVQEQQRADEASRQKAAAEAAQLARAARAAPPPPAPVVKTVEQTCASSGNFLSREVCRLRSCSNAALASDPVCVRFREMEAANRQAVAN